MEYAPLGSICDYFLNTEDVPHGGTVKSILLGISSGMRYLHDMGVVHNDLKSNNVLLMEDLSAKVADLGFAKMHVKGASAISDHGVPMYGTIGWIAPEVLLGHDSSESSDVYSFGVLMWEFAIGFLKNPLSLALRQPAEESGQESDAFLKEVVASAHERPQIPKGVPACFAELIKSCWSSDPADRPTFGQINSSLDLIFVTTFGKLLPRGRRKSPSTALRPLTEIIPPIPARSSTSPRVDLLRRRISSTKERESNDDEGPILDAFASLRST